MILTTPDWVSHEGGAIYSVDYHPSAEKIATCGQDNIGGTGIVVIWNLNPIQNEKFARDSNCTKMFAKLLHQAGVNCVRWSIDGSRLAAASDDKVVYVYEYGGRVQSVGSIGSKGITNVEKYKIANSLYHHSMEVMSVEWSQDGKYLASASMDNTIAIWNARRLPERIIALDSLRGGHTGPVKGLSWDPIGKYLASQSSDKTIRLWTIDNWQCDMIISKPFTDSGQTTMFSRLDWSSDGQYLIAPGATNNEGPVAQVIRRKDWDMSLDLVGYRKAVTCVSTCPNLITYKDAKGKIFQTSLVAVGSRDKSLCVWIYPNVHRPIFACVGIFRHTIMDLSWRGTDLIACSQDGSIKHLRFTEKEVGRLLKNEEMAILCESLYKVRPIQFGGDRTNLPFNEQTPNKNGFIDTPEQLVAKRMAEAAALQKNKMDENETKVASPTQAPVVNKVAQSVQLAEKRKEQVETITKEGKRRIQPVFLGSTVDEEPMPAPTIQKPKQVTAVVRPISPVKTKSAGPPSKKRKIELSTDESSTAAESTGDDTSDDDETINRPSTSAPKSTEKEDANRKARMMMFDFKKPVLRPVETMRIQVTEATTFVELPPQRATITESVTGVIGDTIEVNNEYSCSGVKASQISYSKGEMKIWTSYVEAIVAISVANKYWTALGCYDHSVRVISCSSGRLQCCLQLDSAPVRMGFNGHKMFVLTQTGRFSSWDVDKKVSILSRQPISDCVTTTTKDANLSSINISTSGMPLLEFKNGSIFTYSTDMLCWQLVDAGCSLMRLCDSVAPEELADSQLGKLLKRRQRPALVPNAPLVVRSNVREGILEGWLLSAQSIGSSADYRRILHTYVQHLITNKSKQKLTEVLRQLDGSGSICGLLKTSLRQDIVSLIEKDVNLAHIVAPSKNSFSF